MEDAPVFVSSSGRHSLGDVAQNGLLREHVLAQQMEPVLLHHDRAIDLSQDLSPEAIDVVDEAMQKDEDAFAAHVAQVSLAMVSTECPEFTTGRGEAPWRDISGRQQQQQRWQRWQRRQRQRSQRQRRQRRSVCVASSAPVCYHHRPSISHSSSSRIEGSPMVVACPGT